MNPATRREEDPIEAVHLRVSGRVQGVGFRYFVVHEAQACGVTGYVRNLDDGRVEARAEGGREALERFVSSVRRGPRMASVDDLELERLPASGGFRGFDVVF